MTIKELRESKCLSQMKVAEMCDVDQTMISQIETGKRRPSPDLAAKIGKIFDLSVTDIWSMFYERPMT